MLYQKHFTLLAELVNNMSVEQLERTMTECHNQNLINYDSQVNNLKIKAEYRYKEITGTFYKINSK